jgi:hypothetical protein
MRHVPEIIFRSGSDHKFETDIWGLPWTIDNAQGIILGTCGPQESSDVRSELHRKFKMVAPPDGVEVKRWCDSISHLVKPTVDSGLELV